MGGEWALLTHVADPTAAFHILRLVGGGIRGPAKRRTWQSGAPDHCHHCGAEGTAIRWATRTQEHPGLGWCPTCLDPADPPADLWLATLTEDEACNPSVAQRRETDRPLGPALNLPALPSAFPACPLCRRGEGGAEHLLT